MDPISPEELVSAVKGHPQGPVPAPSITGVSTDSRSIKPGDAFVALVGAKFDGHDYAEAVLAAGASVVIASRRDIAAQAQAKNWPVVLVDDTTAALGRLAAWYRKTLSAKLVAVTGSNGKTTTKKILETVLGRIGRVISAPKSFNNNIGVPLTLLSASRTHSYIVLEMGTNHPGEIAELGALARPDLAVISSLGPAHIEHFGSLDSIAREKTSLLEYVPPTGFAAVNIGEPAIRPYLRTFKGRLLTFGTCKEAELRAESIESDGTCVRFKVNGRWPVVLPLAGRHNATNALGAWAVGVRLGMSPEQIIEALAEATPPEMRLQKLQYGRLTVINDAYNANAASVAAGLWTLADMPVANGGRRVAVLADMLELGSHSEELHRQTGRLLAELGQIQGLVAVGPQAQLLADEAAARASGLAVQRFAGTDEAVKGIARIVRPDDTVLLKGSRGMQLEKLLGPLEAIGNG